MTLTLPKRLDFRQWSAEHIIKAWEEYGDLNRCLASVSGSVSFPKIYAVILMNAASMSREAKDKRIGSPPSRSEEIVKIEIPQEVVSEALLFESN